MLPGVYRAVSCPESWHQKLIAACLWAGEGAVVSHLTAARLHGLEGLPAQRHREKVEVTVPFANSGRAAGLRVHRSRKLERVDRSAIDGIPVTALPRTIIDLSAMLDERHLCVAIDSGLARRRWIDVDMIRRELRRLKTQGRKVAPGLQRLLDERAPDAVVLDSALERRFSAALRRSGLPRPVEHFDVVENGRHVAEIDFAYPRVRLGIQLNGANVHRRHGVWERDQAQLSELAAAGWRIIHVTWAQLETDEAGVLLRVARALSGERTQR
jgi:hypothetical protein